MEHQSEINVSRFVLIGVVATFGWLRRLIFAVGLLGVLLGGYGAYLAHTSRPVVSSSVNPHPVCNREFFAVVSAPDAPADFGRYQQIQSPVTKEWNRYVKEANGTGWCIIKRDPRTFSNGHLYRWYEVPTQYGQVVEQHAKAPKVAYEFRGVNNPIFDKLDNIDFTSETIMYGGITLFSAVILIFIWLPAAILAALGRRWLHNVKEEEA